MSFNNRLNPNLTPTRAAPLPPAPASTAKPIIKNNSKSPNRRGWVSMKDDNPIMSWLWTKKWLVLNSKSLEIYKNDVRFLFLFYILFNYFILFMISRNEMRNE